MTEASGGRHCDQCNKKVYDFTDSKADEFVKILAENNYQICGRFNKQQLASKTPVISIWKKWLSAAMVLVGINLWSCKDKVPQTVQKKPLSNQQANNTDSNFVVGEVAIDLPDTLPEFFGGEQAMSKFITSNLHYHQDKPAGRLIVSFDVNTDGILSNYNIIKGLTPKLNNEAISVLKKMPKWKPAVKNGKPVKFNYTIPIVFTNNKSAKG